jgi:DNA-binding transcriptional ArsR family regulator
MILPGIILPKMGMKKESIAISDALFSKVQQRVMALLFGQPERSFYTSEILRHVNSGVGAVDRELSRLQRCGLVTVERIGNHQKHYRANKEAAVFEDLRGLLEKTVM